ncbi:hypothetical protein Misp01_08900 [Microtetraspora sp. NBRC 13810]|uniref:DUF885 domain-containing protein n=1 Tax=Microtetraspora sp. NBRC 13810 TaxID=3030990 RepID=UPI0024A5F95E|nr:DUF885 domain-containing protein [Microtetraspora sp. NBRC 13810]GLW05760.1 hypothetical protein Misp01_08900 [Microtetraspora sp. NBRC 13810]
MPSTDPHPELARLSADFFQVQHATDPFTATLLGVSGFDDRVPDPSRSGAAAGAAGISAIEERLGRIDASALGEADRINHAVLGALAWGARQDLEHGLWEANASAASYVSPQAMAFQSVGTASLAGPDAADGYLRRLEGLPAYFDAIARRYREARQDGRVPTAVGVGQAIDQLGGHLAAAVDADVLMHPGLPDGRTRTRAATLIETGARPAMRRLLDTLRDELLPVARPDDRVGIRFVPGGEEGYRAAVRRHTTTELTPEEIHRIGLDCLDRLAEEWSELGGRALGTTDVPEIMRRLREDPALRFERTEDIVATVGAALRRAEEARPGWFPAYDIPECVIEEISPIEAGNAPLAYYRPPAAGGARPGAHCVLTADPGQRFTYEYEALAFHESVPGHHLQIASAQTLAGLPDYRRHLDAEVGAYVEGWGLYSERLADEMGLYTSDVARLGMLSFEALRACRLVVDTGMHHFGWSRGRAMRFMWENTATTRANVANEIDRYIAWPGQALGYMIGRREIGRLRDEARRRLGARFDIRAFHGTVLGNGAVPMGVLEQIVLRWIGTVA